MSNLDINSIQVETSHELVSEVRRLIIAYRQIFREPPQSIAINCLAYLTLLATLHNANFRSSDEITMEGVRVVPKAAGYPEVIVAQDHITHLAYLRDKNDPKLNPILMGA